MQRAMPDAVPEGRLQEEQSVRLVQEGGRQGGRRGEGGRGDEDDHGGGQTVLQVGTSIDQRYQSRSKFRMLEVTLRIPKQISYNTC